MQEQSWIWNEILHYVQDDTCLLGSMERNGYQYSLNRANIRVAAQDLQKIAPFADYISPMCYYQMLKRDAEWIACLVDEMDKKAPGQVLPSIQVYPYYIDDPYSIEDFRNCTNNALEDPSQGVVFFSWPLFKKDPGRMKIFK